ncbi:hypothetical protein ACP4OV_013675 [Aristida adscensionis]
MSSKRKSFSAAAGDRGGGKRPAPQQRQHLYLLLDDWERGYSVRKVDVDAFDSGAGAGAAAPPERFPEPPLARIEAPHVWPFNFVSHGTKIFAMRPKEASPAIPAFDTRTLCLSMCPWPSLTDYVVPLLASIDGKLFLFLDDLTGEYLGDPPPCHSKAPWSWTAIHKPLPFHTTHITCYALHPDGRTLFVSAAGGGGGERKRSGTFSFDAERLEWTRHGDWLLPFAGQAFFDVELDAWVGLSGDEDAAGRICSCHVPAAAAAGVTRRPPPSWKLVEGKLFSTEAELHRGAKLVHMGEGKFCIVESMFHEDDSMVDIFRSQPRRKCVLQMTTFRLKHNELGRLQIMRLAQARMTYKQPHVLKASSSEPLAFWI